MKLLKKEKKNYKLICQSIGLFMALVLGALINSEKIDVFIFMGVIFGWVIGVIIELIKNDKVKVCSIYDMFFLFGTALGVAILKKVSIYFMIGGLILGELIEKTLNKK